MTRFKHPAGIASLYAAAFLAVSSIAAFYGFYLYLEAIGTPPAWRGLILGLEPLAAFLVRPFAAPRLHAGNAAKGMRLGLAGLVLVLPCYALFPSPLVAAVLRMAHGAFFAIFFSGLITAYVRTIPQGQSGRAFGTLSLVALLPYAVIPALIGFIAGAPDQAGMVYAVMAAVLLPAFFLTAHPLPAAAPDEEHPKETPFKTGPGLKAALAVPGLGFLLAASFLLVTAQMAAFFFIKPFATGIDVAEPELFFTCLTGSCIAVRLLGNPYFDAMNKRRAILTATALTCAGYAALAFCQGPVVFFSVALLLGACQGVVTPLLNSLAYALAPGRLRGLCVNLMLSTLDAGLFVGPWLGGTILAQGRPYKDIFLLSAGCSLAGLLFIFFLRKNAEEGSPSA